LLPAAADAMVPFAAGVTWWPVPPLAILLTIWLLPRAGRAIFWGGDASAVRRRRARALSCYATAPLVLLPVGVLVWGAGVVMDAQRIGGNQAFPVAGSLMTGGFLLVACCFFWSWVNMLRLSRRAIQSSGLGTIIGIVGLPIAWCAWVLMSVLVLPWVAGLLWLMFDSLHGP
jgi:hypothetical protein